MKKVIFFLLLFAGCATPNEYGIDPPVSPFKFGMSVEEFSEIFGRPIKLKPLWFALPDGNKKNFTPQYSADIFGVPVLYEFNYQKKFIGTYKQWDSYHLNQLMPPYAFDMSIDEFQKIYGLQIKLTPLGIAFPDGDSKETTPQYFFLDDKNKTRYIFNYKSKLIGFYKVPITYEGP